MNLPAGARIVSQRVEEGRLVVELVVGDFEDLARALAPHMRRELREARAVNRGDVIELLLVCALMAVAVMVLEQARGTAWLP